MTFLKCPTLSKLTYSTFINACSQLKSLCINLITTNLVGGYYHTKECRLDMTYSRFYLCPFLLLNWIVNTGSVHFSRSHVWLWDPKDCNMPGFPVHYQLPEFTQIHVHWVGDFIQPSHPLLFPSIFPQSRPLPSLFPSIRVFSNESVFHIRWPKYWSFELQHQSFEWILRTDLL